MMLPSVPLNQAALAPPAVEIPATLSHRSPTRARQRRRRFLMLSTGAEKLHEKELFLPAPRFRSRPTPAEP
jgi:hypothetical protein